jgi:hypothetical protein
MVRAKLRKKHGRTLTLSAIVDRTSVKPASVDAGKPQKVLLLTDVFYGYEHLADHVWVPWAGAVARFAPRHGQLIEFEARVNQYRKGKGIYRHPDYGLSQIKKIRILEDIEVVAI